MKDDAELLRAYAENRSETAFAEFVGRRIGFVYATALRVLAGNTHSAQDVTQAVFVLVASKPAALARHGRPAGWLHATTCNLSRKLVREACRRASREQEAARMSEIENDNNDSVGGGGAGLETHAPDMAPGTLRPMLDEVLGALREGEREAVLLRYFEGEPFAAIGAKLSMPEDAARMRVTRAVEKMRAAFAKRGVTSSAAALGALMSAEAAQAAPAGLAASVSAGAMTATAAGAAVATATFAGGSAFLTFMSSAKITTVAVVAVLIASGGAYFGVQNERASSAALARTRQENARLETQLARLRALEKQSAVTGAPTAPATKPASATARDAEAAGRALMAAHPEIREKLAAAQRVIDMESFLRLSHQMNLNLSLEQNARLAELAAQAQIRSFSLSFEDDEKGVLTISSADIDNGAVRQDAKSRADELRDLLGEEGLKKWNDLTERNAAGRGFSDELSKALYFTEEPLTSRQAQALEEIAYDLRENTDPEARWSAIAERAKPVLSPEQMRAFMAVGDQYVWRQEQSKWYREYKAATTRSK